jgi:type IV secretory pathway VirB6-like protein
MFGPIMIPFLAFDKLAFLFWGWLRAFIGFCFYKVVAAAVLSVLGNLLSHYYMTMPSFADPGMMVKQLPLLILLTLINIYVLFQVPHLTMSIFSGSTGGNGSGLMTTAALLLKA